MINCRFCGKPIERNQSWVQAGDGSMFVISDKDFFHEVCFQKAREDATRAAFIAARLVTKHITFGGQETPNEFINKLPEWTRRG